MSKRAVKVTVIVAKGSTAVTWEVASILVDSLSGLGLSARLGEHQTVASDTPIVIFGQGATVAPTVSQAQARRAVVVLLAGPGTQAFSAAAGLARSAAGCFAVSPRTVALLRAQGIRVDRFILGHTERWDTGGLANRSKTIDIVHTGEVDGPGRSVLARLAPELATIRSHIELTASRRDSPSTPPDFAASALLADATLTLCLSRRTDTTLDWPSVVRAMCNGSVVIAERTTGCGELIPGEHFVMTRPESIMPVIRACMADPQALTDMATAAYELCRTQLTMKDSLERLANVADRSGTLTMILPRRAHAAVALSSSSTRSQTLERLEFAAVGPFGDAPDGDAEIDVICVEHPDAGPISLTRDSLAGHPIRINLHVGTIGTAESPLESPTAGHSEPNGRYIAQARNDLLRRCSAQLVMFVDSGDEILNGTLGQLGAALCGSPPSDIYMPLVALGSDDLACLPLHGPPPGAAGGEDPPRGYIVRRSYLDRIGPFVHGEDGAAGVDRAFWLRAAAAGGRVALLPLVGVRLWQQTKVS